MQHADAAAEWPHISGGHRRPTSKLLFEAGYISDILHYSDYDQPGIRADRGTPEWFSRVSHVNISTNFRTVAGQLEQLIVPNQDTAATSLTYVTGSHNIKVGSSGDSGRTATTPTSTPICTRTIRIRPSTASRAKRR